MKTIRLIDDFATSIYFDNSDKLKEKYFQICESFAEDFDKVFNTNDNNLKLKNQYLMQMFEMLQTNDFIKMSDYLVYKAKSILTN